MSPASPFSISVSSAFTAPVTQSITASRFGASSFTFFRMPSTSYSASMVSVSSRYRSASFPSICAFAAARVSASYFFSRVFSCL